MDTNAQIKVFFILFVFIWNLGTEDIEDDQKEGDKETDAQVCEGIFPSFNFAEGPHKKRIPDEEAQAGSRNGLEHFFLFAVKM